MGGLKIVCKLIKFDVMLMALIDQLRAIHEFCCQDHPGDARMVQVAENVAKKSADEVRYFGVLHERHWSPPESGTRDGGKIGGCGFNCLGTQ